MAKGKDEEKTAILDPGNILFILYVGAVIGVIFLALVVDSLATAGTSERDELHLSELQQSEMMVAGTEEKADLQASALKRDAIALSDQ